MSKRVYNILFHTHTISGIVISLALYVIFFTGSFSFFRDEIISWERDESIQHGWKITEMNIDRAIDSIQSLRSNPIKDISFEQHYEEPMVGVRVSDIKTNSLEEEADVKPDFFYLNTRSFQIDNYQSAYTLGEFIYRLHFFAQLNFYGKSGYLLAGLTAFFFLFAIITGVLVHWKKIISNFFLFRPKASLKNLWTDAHTSLGMIGLPFQLMYALTGVYIMIGLSVMAPAIIAFVYQGDVNKAYDDFGLNPPSFELVGQPLTEDYSISHFVNKARSKWQGFEIDHISIFNLGDENMHVQLVGKSSVEKKFASEGSIIYQVATGEIIQEKNPFTDQSYFDSAKAILYRLHYGDFGGKVLKLIYFILGLLTCFVIISGVMIWLVARDKNHVSTSKRKFNQWLVHFYLAASLSLFPVTAFSFVMIKVGDVQNMESPMGYIYSCFFWSWLILTLIFTFLQSNTLTTKLSLILGGGIGLLIPVVNGLISGNWIWDTFMKGESDIFLVDSLWLVMSVSALIVGKRMNSKKADKELIRQPSSNITRPVSA